MNKLLAFFRPPPAPKLDAMPSDRAALARFGHAVDLAVYDIGIGRRSRADNDNVIALADIFTNASLEIGETHVAPQSMTTTTRGLLLTIQHRDGTIDMVAAEHTFAILARELRLASTGGLGRKPHRLLLHKLVELGSVSLSASGIPSTVATYGARTAATLRMSNFTIAY